MHYKFKIFSATFYYRVSPRELLDVMVRTRLVKNATVDWGRFPIEQKGFT